MKRFLSVMALWLCFVTMAAAQQVDEPSSKSSNWQKTIMASFNVDVADFPSPWKDITLEYLFDYQLSNTILFFECGFSARYGFENSHGVDLFGEEYRDERKAGTIGFPVGIGFRFGSGKMNICPVFRLTLYAGYGSEYDSYYDYNDSGVRIGVIFPELGVRFQWKNVVLSPTIKANLGSDMEDGLGVLLGIGLGYRF